MRTQRGNAGEFAASVFMEVYQMVTTRKGVRTATGSVVALAGLLPTPWREELAHTVGEVQAQVFDATEMDRMSTEPAGRSRTE